MRRISISWGALSAGLAGVAIAVSISLADEEGRATAQPVPTGPSLPSSPDSDTLSAQPGRLDKLRRETGLSGQVSAVSSILLANTESAPDPVLTGPVEATVETFPLAEARTGAVDSRFSLTVAETPRAVAGSAVASLAAVSGGASRENLDRAESPSSEELVRRIEGLRSGYQEARDRDSSADSATAQVSTARRDTPPPVAVIGEEPVGARPYSRARPAIGARVAERTLADAEPSDHPSPFAAANPPAETAAEREIASIGSGSPSALSDVAAAAPPMNSPERKGLLGRLFSKKPSREDRAAAAAAAASRPTLENFPKPDAPRTKASKAEDEAQVMIDQIYSEYVDRVDRITATDLSPDGAKGLPPIPRDFETVWMDRVRKGYWVGEEPLAVRLEELYARALIHSNRVRVYGYDPLIRETAIEESEGAFDLEAFVNGTYGKSDEPTSSILDTGEIGRFLEDRGEGDAGLRRRFATGGQLTLSNRFVTLRNNSEFVEPNPQTSSTVVLSVAQPLLKGGGYHYNKARLKVAKIDSGVAASEYVGQLENHLLEVNQAYWGVYFARAAYLLRKSLAGQTGEIVEKLEARSDEATASELLRARSELSRRRTSLNRSELAIRNAEEKLRSLVNDPEFPIGGDGEFVPVTSPVLDPPRETVHAAAMEAVDNRPEIAASFGQLRVAAIRNQAGEHEMLPQLDLLAETRMAGLDANRRVAGAYDDMLGQNASWLVGFQFSQPWERNFAKSRHERLQYEFLKQADMVRATMDNILLESVVTYREMMTVYRDLQGNLQQVLSTREEVRGLRERLDIDAENGQTVAYRLQNVLDALERNQIAEEQFLVSVVTYNIAFASLERAKGTFLRYQDVTIEREPSPEHKRLETLRAVPGAPVSGGAVSGAK